MRFSSVTIFVVTASECKCVEIKVIFRALVFVCLSPSLTIWKMILSASLDILRGTAYKSLINIFSSLIFILLRCSLKNWFDCEKERERQGKRRKHELFENQSGWINEIIYFSSLQMNWIDHFVNYLFAIALIQ